MNRKRRLQLSLVATVATLALSGCGLFSRSSSSGASAPSAVEGRTLLPTFTPTPQGAAPEPTATVVFAAALPEPVAALAPLTATAPLTASAPLTAAAEPAAEPTPTPPAAAPPRLIITEDLVNVRTGPGLEYGLGGTATKDQAFDIIGRSESGEWWQVCCVSGEPVWVYEELARDENADDVPTVAGNPAPAQPIAQPVAQAPAAPAPAEPPPTDTPAPPAPPPAADPCANIGGDGCKFKVRGGPAFAPNGGGELKLTLAFIHSGIDGGQPQGSYFPVLLKDGQNLGIPDSVRSFDPSIAMREGPNGRYNYEYKVDLGRIPGGNVAGNYTIFVLDGNGERDSQDFNFSVPDGQGEVWIQFDQG